jgi:hypothetical protein
MPKISPKGMGIFTMDFICLGSNGFAQLGQDDYEEKARLELNALINYMYTVHPVPEGFRSIAIYKIKRFPHDFGSYMELVIVYDDEVLESIRWKDLKEFQRFWAWASEAEDWDLESLEAHAVVSEAWYLHNWNKQMRTAKIKRHG